MALPLMMAGALAACTPYAVGEAAAVSPDRVWKIYEGQAADGLSARIASVFEPVENSADRLRVFEVSGGFLLLVQPQVFRVFAQSASPESLLAWFLPTAGGATEWSRSLDCTNQARAVTSPLAFLGERANGYYLLLRCLSSERGRASATHWVVRLSSSEEPVFREIGRAGAVWSVWIHGDYLVQTEYREQETRLMWEHLTTGKSGSSRVKGHYGRGWLGLETASEWATGESGLARLKEESGGMSLQPVPGATETKFGKCAETAVYARMFSDRFIIVCVVAGKLSVASGTLAGLEAARMEQTTRTVDWTDPVYPPEDLTFLEAPGKGILVIRAGQQVFGVDLRTGSVRHAMSAKNAGVVGDRLSVLDARPPGRLAVRHHDLVSGRLISSLQSDLKKESVSVLSLLYPFRSGLIMFNLATGRVIFLRSSSLPSEVTGAPRLP
jgi:hypothetical protein